MLCIKSLGAILRNRLVNTRLRIKDTHLWYIFLLFGLISDCDLGAFGSPIGWNEDVVVSWKDHTKENQEQANVCQNKPRDHHWIISQGVEFRICEAEHNRQDRCTDITEQDRPESWDVPVPITTNHEIEVTSQLITL